MRKDASGRIYTYAEKYLGGGEGLSSAPRELPADIPGEVAERIRTLAEQVAPVALVRGAPRIDFLWHGDDIWVNEINTIPGALAWYFWSRRRGRRSRRCSATCSRRPSRDPCAPARPRAPTARPPPAHRRQARLTGARTRRAPSLAR